MSIVQSFQYILDIILVNLGQFVQGIQDFIHVILLLDILSNDFRTNWPIFLRQNPLQYITSLEKDSIGHETSMAPRIPIGQ